ncbi:MAG: hypothetical protein F9B45_06715 [Phycisphaera sp. RhM]|nr:hypothetical protein [Phycisphaera sp. RhM]
MMRVRQAQVSTTQHFRRIGRVPIDGHGWRIIEFTGRGSVFVGDRRQQVRGKYLGIARASRVTDKCCRFLFDR